MKRGESDRIASWRIGVSMFCGSSMTTTGRHARRNSTGAYPFIASVGRLITFVSFVKESMLITMICRCDDVANCRTRVRWRLSYMYASYWRPSYWSRMCSLSIRRLDSTPSRIATLGTTITNFVKPYFNRSSAIVRR